LSSKAISKILKNSIPVVYQEQVKKILMHVMKLKICKRFRIHTFISTSPLHMKHKLNKTPEQVLDAIKESVTYARNLLMMLNGHVKMEQEQIWILCVK
jgi:2-isopropylmalate synthase